ncbi:MAG: hypothetical protein ACI9ON_003378 [Limisphaerales bacterium]|jgi:hypothetical protein
MWRPRLMLNLNEEVLMAIAQIAIALIGFGGVVVTLGRSESGRWSSAERLQLRTLVEPSIMVLSGSFIPLVVSLADFQSETVWRVSNGLLFCFHAIAHGLFLIRGLKYDNAVVLSQRMIGTVGIFIYASLIASACALIAYHQLTFLIGLLYGLFVSVHNFYLLLFRSDEDSPLENTQE